jgi:glucose/arabinose dehydrogenase
VILEQAYDDPSEIGFLGLAFHPNYAQNGYVYTKYTPQANLDFISRFTKSPEGDFLDVASEYIILQLPKEDIMHHGGSPVFGRDGMLWVATGDGVHFSKCYREDNPAPNLGTLLGKMLRIDVDGEANGMKYRIPADNPFVGNKNGIREEIYAYGLRNPWKFTIDPPTQQIWFVLHWAASRCGK